MSEKLTALASENLNPGLRSLLEDVQHGHIRVPRFRRSFIWDDEQRILLLDSISKKMPIGSLLIWRTTQFKLASFNAIGPQTIAPIVAQNYSIGWQYLLDGHQRISTLLGLLLPPPEEHDKNADADVHGKEVDWDIQYDLMDGGFVFPQKIHKTNAPAPPLLPLWTLLDSRLMSRRMREIRKQAPENGWTEENLDQWEQRADSLAYRFQECRIPVVVMATDDLDLAKTTAQRVNSQGTAMSEADLMAALTWQPEFDLRDRISTLREDLPHGWRELPDPVFLQVCKGLADLDIMRGDEYQLVEKIKKDADLLTRAGNCLQQAIELLETHAGVVGQQFLPYQLQLALLAIELGKRKRDDDTKLHWLNWFWRTSWNESFGAATYRMIRNEQTFLRQTNTSIEWERDALTPGRFDFRLARTKLLMCRMALRPDLLDHKEIALDGRNMLAQYGRDALSRLFPAPTNATEELKKLVQGAGNQVFYNPADVKSLREHLLQNLILSPQVLQSLFIDTTALAALREGDLETFIARRFQAIDAWDKTEYEFTMAQAGGGA